MNQENNNQTNSFQNQNMHNNLNVNQQMFNAQQDYHQSVNVQNHQQVLQQNNMQPNENSNNKSNKKIGLIVGLILVIIAMFIVSPAFNKDTKNDGEEEKQVVEKDYISIGQLDENINFEYNEYGSFFMRITNIYTWAGRGTVVEGTILRGTIELGDQIQILGIDKDLKQTTVGRVEISRKEVQSAKMNDMVSLILDDYRSDEISVGQVVVASNSMIASTKFIAELNISTTITNNNSYDICFNDFCQKGKTIFDDTIQTVNSNEVVASTIYMEVLQPIEVGFEFEIRQNNNIVGTGKITEIFN